MKPEWHEYEPDKPPIGSGIILWRGEKKLPLYYEASGRQWICRDRVMLNIDAWRHGSYSWIIRWAYFTPPVIEQQERRTGFDRREIDR